MYCDDCGAWIKWLGKDELRAFEHSVVVKEPESKIAYVENGVSPIDKRTVIDRLQEFVDFLDVQIDKELTKEPLSVEDSISKCSYAHAYEKDKNALLNIISGRNWNDNGE